MISSELATHKLLINSANKYVQKTADVALGVVDQSGKTANAALETASNALSNFWGKKG
jgi:hypothetical protein